MTDEHMNNDEPVSGELLPVDDHTPAVRGGQLAIPGDESLEVETPSALALADSLEELLAALKPVRFPLELPGSDKQSQQAESIRGQIRDYLLPRAMTLDAPLLAVVGGSTGAGKSTLVNSLLRQEVTRPGVLRPTTKAPVLVCHPDDAAWFRSGRVLPELTRSNTELADTRALQIVETDHLMPGLALLDAPDVDSIDEDNRNLARQLLLAADMWLFVTSAARYADAVPWGFLREASEREMVLSVIVNRCPPQSLAEVARDLAALLSEQGLGDAPLFAVPEAPLDDSFIQDEAVAPIRRWLGHIASQAGNRADVIKQSLGGALRQLEASVETLETGLQQQRSATSDLGTIAEGAFVRASQRVSHAVGDGSMLRGEIINHWHDVVGTSSVFRGLDDAVSSLRAMARRWAKAEPKAEEMQAAVSDQLAKVFVQAAEQAIEDIGTDWSRSTWGRDLLTEDLRLLSGDFESRAIASVRAWQQDVLALVSDQGKDKRFKARLFALGTNVLGVTLMVVVFASTGGLTGAEAGIAGGTSLVAQRLLESVFGSGAVERLATTSRQLLLDRVNELFREEKERFDAEVAKVSVPEEVGEELASAERRVRKAGAALSIPVAELLPMETEQKQMEEGR